jgi:1,4-alpha-glucan branching enzyme
MGLKCSKEGSMVEATTAREETAREQASASRARWEEHRVRGEKIVARLRELLHEGNARHVVIKNDEGKTLIEFPVTVGVAGALLVPVWAAVGALAALVANCTIQVEREG